MYICPFWLGEAETVPMASPPLPRHVPYPTSESEEDDSEDASSEESAWSVSRAWSLVEHRVQCTGRDPTAPRPSNVGAHMATLHFAQCHPQRVKSGNVSLRLWTFEFNRIVKTQMSVTLFITVTQAAVDLPSASLGGASPAKLCLTRKLAASHAVSAARAASTSAALARYVSMASLECLAITLILSLGTLADAR
jgi:hypothetical protein